MLKHYGLDALTRTLKYKLFKRINVHAKYLKRAQLDAKDRQSKV